MALYGLAMTLHKTVAEIEEMSVEEFLGWMAYIRVRNDAKSNS